MIYTELTLSDAQEMLDHFGGGRAMALDALSGGFANSNYRVDRKDDTPLVLKVWDNVSPERAQRVAGYMLHLADHGVPTPAPLVTDSGRAVILRGGQAWMLQPFVPGHWLPLNPTALTHLGAAIAQLHQAPPPDNLPQGFQMGLCLMEAAHADALEQACSHPFVAQLKDEMARFRAELPKSLPRGVVHGDIFPDNVIAEGDEIRAILDFEEVAEEHFVLDIAMAFVGCGWQDGAPVRERWDALLAGYESVRPLSSEEHSALPIYLRYATVGIATWRFDQFVLRRPELGLERRHQEMMTRLARPGGLY